LQVGIGTHRAAAIVRSEGRGKRCRLAADVHYLPLPVRANVQIVSGATKRARAYSYNPGVQQYCEADEKPLTAKYRSGRGAATGHHRL
jgi:hypothetical protein